MEVKERLVELQKTNCVKGKRCIEDCLACMADHLIANGVTIHGWIPVAEGMPEEHQSVVPGLGTVSKPVLVTWMDPTSDKPYPDNCFVREGITRNGEFTIHHINGDLVPLAWMPQPKPYQQPSGVSK